MAIDNALYLKTDIQPILRAYRIRWLILLIYIIYSSLSGIQWLQYAIITNLIVKYYKVSVSDVNWTTMVFMILWPLLAFPASFVVDRAGLRVAALCGAIFSAIGATVKVFSIGPDLFYVVMIGQVFAAVSQVFIFTLPPTIASTWFLPREASTVCSLGMFSLMFSTALSFLIPPIIVRDHEEVSEIGSDLKIMCWGLALPTVSAALLVILYFPKFPHYAPSLAAHHSRESELTSVTTFVENIKRIVTNRSFLLHTLSYTCMFGVYSAFDTLLNQLVLQYFPGAQEDAGRMGLFMVIIGIIGTVLVGIILDKTHRYKEVAIVIFILCSISMGLFLLALEMRLMWMCYMAIGLLGFFFSAYLPLGFELAIELTYPLPENMVNTMLVAFSQVIAVLITMTLSYVNVKLGALESTLIQMGIFALGTLTTLITPNKLNRQSAFRNEDHLKINFEKVGQDEPRIA